MASEVKEKSSQGENRILILGENKENIGGQAAFYPLNEEGTRYERRWMQRTT